MQDIFELLQYCALRKVKMCMISLQVIEGPNKSKWMLVTFKLQCSPYKEVTGKIYLLKQHFLQSATRLKVY